MVASASPPVGVVGLLFTDIEGSTSLARRLGAKWAGVQARHHAIVREVIGEFGGWVDGIEGDAFFATFADRGSAGLAAVAAQRRLRAERWPVDVGELRVRMGVHVGAVERTEVGYVGLDIHLAARVEAAAHGGQVLMTLPARRAVGASVQVEDLGLHRLRDFPRPEHLYCAVVDGQGADAFPPPRTLDVRPTNLPTAPELIGRGEDVKALMDLLERPESRLVTVSGRGGSGKTSLALAVGQELLDRFRGGVWWVPLATRVRASDVWPSVAAAVHADPTGRLPVLDALAARFEIAPTLLILDNLEHLLDAAGDLTVLLDRVPTLRILVTSQTRLHVPGEHVFPLSELDEDAAIELFVHSGRRALPGWELDDGQLAAVREVCARLDRLPLAIELVAARLSVLSADDIATQLGKSFDLVSGTRRGDLPRHESLAATIAWTLGNLDADARTLFAVQGVFARSPSLADIQTVASEPGTALLNGMGELVDFALVQRVADEFKTERFAMPEALRQAAATALDLQPDANGVRRRHALLVQRVMDAASWLIMATTQAHRDALWLSADAARALDWARRHDPELAAAIAAPWSLILADVGRLRESRPLWEFALNVSGGSESVRAQALFAQGISAMQEGNLDAALAHGDDALALVKDSDPDRYAEFLIGLAGLRGFMGDNERAIADVVRGVERAESMGPAALSGALFFEAQVRLFAGDATGALIAHRRAVEVGEASGGWAVEVIDTQRGDLALAFGDVAQALPFYLASFDGALRRGDEGQVNFDLCSIAECLAGLERCEAAAEVTGIARAHAIEIYATAMFVDQTLQRGDMPARLIAALSPDTLERCVEAGRHIEPGQRPRRVHELCQSGS